MVGRSSPTHKSSIELLQDHVTTFCHDPIAHRFDLLEIFVAAQRILDTEHSELFLWQAHQILDDVMRVLVCHAERKVRRDCVGNGWVICDIGPHGICNQRVDIRARLMDL